MAEHAVTVQVDDTIIYTIVDGGDEFGVDGVTPMRWHIGKVDKVRDGVCTYARSGQFDNLVKILPRWIVRIVPNLRIGEPIDGRLRLLRAGVDAVLYARGSWTFDGSFAQLTEWVGKMANEPAYREVAESANGEAVSALLTWVNDHYTSIHQALEKMAERNEASAADFTDAPMVAKTLRESAANWRDMAREISTLLNTVWDTTPRIGETDND